MKYLKMFGFVLIAFLLSALLISILSYFNILNGKILIGFKIGIPLLIIFISSIKLGKTTTQKGFVSGIINGLAMILFMVLLNLIVFKSGFGLQTWIYYLIFFIISMTGGMIGINKKKEA